jgi:hypothetical protein
MLRNTSVVKIPRSLLGVANKRLNEMVRPKTENELKSLSRDRFLEAHPELTEEDLQREEARGNAIKEAWRAHWQAREAANRADMLDSEVPSSPPQTRD